MVNLLFEAVWMTARAPWWLGWALMGGGVFSLGLIVGMRLR